MYKNLLDNLITRSCFLLFSANLRIFSGLSQATVNNWDFSYVTALLLGLSIKKNLNGFLYRFLLILFSVKHLTLFPKFLQKNLY